MPLRDDRQARAPVAQQPIDIAAPSQRPPQRDANRPRWRRALAAALFPLVAVAVIYALARPAWAAIELEYFNVVSSSSAVLLEWSTKSEYNLRGFEVLCKQANEPDAAYHRIGFFNPRGNASQGAQYDMLVTDLQPGRAYCFRLVEITTDDTPGEVRERCGYGLAITPTPTINPTPTLSGTLGITPTIVLFPESGAPGITPTFDPFAPTPTATLFGASPLATPTVDPFATPLGQAPGGAEAAGATPTVDPFAAPTPTVDPFAVPTATVDPFAVPTATIDPFATPTIDPAFASPLETPTPTVDLTATALAANATLSATLALSPTPTFVPGGAQNDEGAPALAGAPEAGPSPTPTSLYEIVTATPLPALSGAAPAVTPWPTATPPTSMLAGLLTPQNLTVMLLCIIFLSATVLGGLGLVTSVLWMRSRSQRDVDELRLRARLEHERRRIY
jgi:hypothetical protein